MEELIVKIEAAGAAAGAGKKDDKQGDEQPKSFFDKMSGAVKGGLKSAGIQFGVSALLKQSQLFTSFAGSIFQIVGGMIDLMLTPLMPIFIPVLKFLAKMMPGVRITATAIINKLIEFGTTIANWWKNNAPSWLQGGDGTQIAQVLGGVLTVLLFSKFTGIWKFASWFLKLKVGQKAAGKVAEAAAKEAGKKGAKTIGQHLKGQIARFIRYLGSSFKNLLYKIPGVEKAVALIKSFAGSIKRLPQKILTKIGSIGKTMGTFFKNIAKNVASHIFKGNKQALRLMIKWITAPLKIAGKFIWGFLKSYFNLYKSFFTKMWGFFKGPLSKVWAFLKGPLSKVLSFFKGPVSIVKGIFTKVWTFLKGPLSKVFNFLTGVGGKIFATIKAGPMAILKGIANIIKTVLAKPFELLGKALGKIPGLGKLAAGLGKIFKGGAGKLIGKIGGKAGLQAAGMSIPVLGSVIGLAAGAYETQRMVRKYGFNAKTIGAGLAYTTLQTGAGFVGGPAGIAAAIAGEVGLMAYEHKVLKVEMGGPDEQTKVSMQNEQGRVTATNLTHQALDYQT